MMINQVILVGRLVADPVIREVSSGKNVCEIKLALQRPFKSQTTHTYETDFIKVTFWEYLAINVNEYSIKGSVLGIKARLQNRVITVNDKPVEIIDVVGEQLIFISKPHNKSIPKSNEEIEDIPFEEIEKEDD